MAKAETNKVIGGKYYAAAGTYKGMNEHGEMVREIPFPSREGKWLEYGWCPVPAGAPTKETDTHIYFDLGGQEVRYVKHR